MRFSNNTSWTILTVGSILLIHTLFSLSKPDSAVINGRINTIGSVADLDAQSSFSFSIFSDNHGHSATGNLYMAKMFKWTAACNDKFILGLGDHVKMGESNEFMRFITSNNYWKENFYPTIADGENGVFGRDESDWGAGKKFLQILGVHERKNVIMNNNGLDYYAYITQNTYSIHFISLHYPDEPAEPELAFKEESKKFLSTILQAIDKKTNDLIIIAAHSKFGFWTEYLSEEAQKLLFAKADLILSGNTHCFERQHKKGYANQGPLIINAGSVALPRFGSPPGQYPKKCVNENLGLGFQTLTLSPKIAKN